MSTALAETKSELTTLQIIDWLNQLFLAADDAETEEDRTAVLAEIERVFAVDLASKVDGVAWFCKSVDSAVALRKQMKAEIDRDIARLEHRKEWLRGVVKHAVQQFGEGKVRGNFHTCSITAGRPSLEIFDEDQIPLNYKLAIVEIRADVWDAVRALMPDITAEVDFKPRTDAIREALISGRDVPGARMKRGEDFLTVR